MILVALVRVVTVGVSRRADLETLKIGRKKGREIEIKIEMKTGKEIEIEREKGIKIRSRTGTKGEIEIRRGTEMGRERGRNDPREREKAQEEKSQERKTGEENAKRGIERKTDAEIERDPVAGLVGEFMTAIETRDVDERGFAKRALDIKGYVLCCNCRTPLSKARISTRRSLYVFNAVS